MASAGGIVLLVGALGIGAGAIYYTRKKRAPALGEKPPVATPEELPATPTDAAINAAAEAADLLVGAGLTTCPDQEPALFAALDVFDEAVLVNPAAALAKLRSDVVALCPGTAGVPGLTIPADTAKKKPGTITGDPVIETDANSLAARIQSEAAANGCAGLTPALVSAFQSAHNREQGAAAIAVNGEYDFTTASAVQLRLTAQGKGFAPQVCAYPDFSPGDEVTIQKTIEGFRVQMENLYKGATA